MSKGIKYSSDKLKPIIQEIEFGTINSKLDSIMTDRNISTYELNKLANISENSIRTLRKNTATRIDFLVLAKICYALDLNVSDIFEYIPNPNIQ